MNICEDCGWYHRVGNYCFYFGEMAGEAVVSCKVKEKNIRYLLLDEVLDTCKFYREDPDGVEHIIRDFEEAVPEDARPVWHGEWTAEGNDEYGNYWDECTNCREAVWFPPFVKNNYKYCPHCGAVMDA